MTTTALASIEAISRHAGVWVNTPYEALTITGEDRASWLQGMVTCEVQLLADRESRYGCALNVKGRIITDFYIYADHAHNRLIMTLPSDRIAPLLGHLEMLLVSEDVELEPMGCAVLSVQGPRSASYLGIAESTEQLYPITVHGLDVIAAKCSRTGLPGYDLIVHKNDTTTVISYLTEQGAKIVNQQDINRFRIQAAIPEIGRDTSEKTLLLEAGLDDAVHWGKGCYLGQEVVRRQGDRGHTNKEIKRVEFEPGPLPSPGDEIWPKEESTKAAGILTSVAYGPDNVGYGLVILRRKHFAPGTPLVVRTSNGTIQCKVSGTRIRDHAVRRDENDPDLVGQTNKTHRALV